MDGRALTHRHTPRSGLVLCADCKREREMDTLYYMDQLLDHDCAVCPLLSRHSHRAQRSPPPPRHLCACAYRQWLAAAARLVGQLERENRWR